jgi:hypothetical protein
MRRPTVLSLPLLSVLLERMYYLDRINIIHRKIILFENGGTIMRIFSDKII